MRQFNLMTESHIRSIIKGISWRIVGTLDTIFISYILTGHISTAIKIGVTEVITKVVLFYLHERLWIRFYGNEALTKKFSFIKAVTWRVIGTIDTMALGWFYSGSPLTGLKIGFTEVATKIILYYLHERLWARVPVGTVRSWFGIKDKTETE